MQRYRAVGHHDTYRRMRETLDLGSTSDRPELPQASGVR